TSAATASFLFPAEDGIRDFHVTGVQTCALPIFARRPAAHVEHAIGITHEAVGTVEAAVEFRDLWLAGCAEHDAEQLAAADVGHEVGRASWRERRSAFGASGACEGMRVETTKTGK